MVRTGEAEATGAAAGATAAAGGGTATATGIGEGTEAGEGGAGAEAGHTAAAAGMVSPTFCQQQSGVLKFCMCGMQVLVVRTTMVGCCQAAFAGKGAAHMTLTPLLWQCIGGGGDRGRY